MQRRYPGVLTVIRDTSEINPLKFPETIQWWDSDSVPHLFRVHVVRESLFTGDYAFKGRLQKARDGRTVALVERKGAMTELWTNLFTDDWRRFSNCLDRMRDEAVRRLLFLDLRPETLIMTTRYVPEPRKVLDKLFRECVRRDIETMLVPPSNSTRSGELVVRWLLAATNSVLWEAKC